MVNVNKPTDFEKMCKTLDELDCEYHVMDSVIYIGNCSWLDTGEVRIYFDKNQKFKGFVGLSEE